MNYYTVCPDCGYKLLKASDGSTIEIHCPKCGAKMLIEIKDGKITIQKTIAENAYGYQTTVKILCSFLRQVGAPTLQARLETIRKRESAQRASLFSARPTPSLSAPFMSPENEIVTRLRLDTLVSHRPLSAIAIPDAHAACHICDKSYPIGVRYSVVRQ